MHRSPQTGYLRPLELDNTTKLRIGHFSAARPKTCILTAGRSALVAESCGAESASSTGSITSRSFVMVCRTLTAARPMASITGFTNCKKTRTFWWQNALGLGRNQE